MEITKSIKDLLRSLKKIMDERTNESGTRMFYFGMFGLISYLPYYFINLQILQPGHYDNVWLRIVVAVLCLLLVLKKYWPKKLLLILPAYWYLTLLYSMPFFITFMTFKNHGSTAWVMNFISIVILMVLLVDWLSYSLLLIIGVLIAWTSFILTTAGGFTYIPGTIGYLDIINTLVPTVIMAIIFSYNKDKIQNEKLRAIEMASTNVAHELGTPLASISAGVNVLNDYLPELFEGYSLSRKNKLLHSDMQPSEFSQLKKTLNAIESEVDHANSIIKILLVNSRQANSEQTNDFNIFKINECIEQALDRYPFFIEDKNLIEWDRKSGFVYFGNQELTIHILFNLIKNSIYYIKNSNKGGINIWLDSDSKYNYLHFKDTGPGIDNKALAHLFDRFYSKTYHGYGIGLSYCKSVMKDYKGDITCKSIFGEYTEFILKFPKADP